MLARFLIMHESSHWSGGGLLLAVHRGAHITLAVLFGFSVATVQNATDLDP
jgi:hypothetical protein